MRLSAVLSVLVLAARYSFRLKERAVQGTQAEGGRVISSWSVVRPQKPRTVEKPSKAGPEAHR